MIFSHIRDKAKTDNTRLRIGPVHLESLTFIGATTDEVKKYLADTDCLNARFEVKDGQEVVFIKGTSKALEKFSCGGRISETPESTVKTLSDEFSAHVIKLLAGWRSFNDEFLALLRGVYARRFLLLNQVFGDEMIFVTEWAAMQYVRMSFWIEQMSDILESLPMPKFQKQHLGTWDFPRQRPFSSLWGVDEYSKEVWEDEFRLLNGHVLGQLDKIWVESGSMRCKTPDFIEYFAQFDRDFTLFKDLKFEEEKNVAVNAKSADQLPATSKEAILVEFVNALAIKGLKKGLESIAEAKKDDDKPRFPYKLPAGTRWENFFIKFIDDEEVHIEVKQLEHVASYKEMGFIGKGNNPAPSQAWLLLRILSKFNGELDWGNNAANPKFKKQKEILARKLQSYFSIDYDPFHPYKQDHSYRIKLTLIPPQKEQ